LADVTLPSLGESVTEGIITQWFKKVGDAVARDEPLFEVSTDKVDSEMPSPAAGVLTQILAEEGDTVQTGARVAVIDESGVPAAPVAASPAASAPLSAPPSAPPSAPSSLAATPVAPVGSDTNDATGVVVSPVVRRILMDGGVEATTVIGTGTGGAITRRDAERAVALGPTEEVVVALSNGQRRMGQHMSVSMLSAPHGFVAVEVDASVFDELDAQGRETHEGFAITDESVVTVAAVRALAEFEFLNATFADDQLTVHRTISVGFTRHVEDDGMLVPVVHAAAGLTLRALSRRTAELDERLSSRQLNADDLMGGTFTVASATSEHTLWSEPIIIQPEVAILSVGAVRHVPVVVTRDGVLSLEVGRRVILGLTFDHRVCDAAAAAKYLERVGELLAGLDVASER
jgi:2-oxoglutarate dehydrogenase E2 component (dihydrolipoamide succinyltransferase)